MQDLIVDDSDLWKNDLRNKFIEVMTGETTKSTYEYIGYAYQCYAPNYIYKYYPDKIDCINTIKIIKCGIPHQSISMIFLIVILLKTENQFLIVFLNKHQMAGQYGNTANCGCIFKE